MPTIGLAETLAGDVLAADVIVNDVVLFEKGTVLSDQRIGILQALGLRTLAVEDRYSRRSGGLEATLRNIDERFSHVENSPTMMRIKSWIQDILMNQEAQGGR